jgi:hypothetical protein
MWWALLLAWFWHGVHLSTAIVDYRTDSRQLEIIIALSADHLEENLRRRTGRDIELDRSPDAAKLTEAYLRERFALREAGGRELPFRWVGWEIKGGNVNLYIEAATTQPDKLQLRNDLLLDWQRDQVNRVLPKRDGKGRPPQLLFWVGTLGEFLALPV